jgi:hypothetical protein
MTDPYPGVGASAPTPFVLKREMTITHADFFRLLPRVFGELYFETDKQSVLSPVGDGSIEIKLAPEQNRKLGALDLPLTEITFCFEKVSDIDSKRFLERFDLVYQRSGG